MTHSKPANKVFKIVILSGKFYYAKLKLGPNHVAIISEFLLVCHNNGTPLYFQNAFNMTAVHQLKSAHNISIPANVRDEDIATLLKIPGMDALKLWKKTAHAKDRVIKEVR